MKHNKRLIKKRYFEFFDKCSKNRRNENQDSFDPILYTSCSFYKIFDQETMSTFISKLCKTEIKEIDDYKNYLYERDDFVNNNIDHTIIEYIIHRFTKKFDKFYEKINKRKFEEYKKSEAYKTSLELFF